MKHVVIINGKGGVGKDTVCEFAMKHYKVATCSSITPVKEVAKKCGWKGEKDMKSRKFLSDLKLLVTEYNGLPFQYISNGLATFLEGKDEILFVHIREPWEIDKFKKHVEKQEEFVNVKCITLLVRRGNVNDTTFGNTSDDSVERYAYDYVYDNDLSLLEAEGDFIKFLKTILEGGAR